MTRLLSLMLLTACAGSQPDSGSADTDTGANPEDPAPCDVGIEVGDCAPDFTMPDRYAQPFTLWSQRGKVALVDISAVW